MKTIKLILSVFILTVFTATFISCGGSNEPQATCFDGIQNGDETGVDCGGSSCEPCKGKFDKSGEIGTETWTSNNIYYLNQKVVVKAGATLTIEPGTIIKGRKGTGSLASALVIQRGAKIKAVGTPEKPIIFTSENDDIEIGQTMGTSLTEDDNALWGGVIILGKAKGSFKGDVKEVQIEGIPAGDTYGLYGGDDNADNSGVLKYVSIRHGGAEIGEGNEINGLTLGAVGSGTVIENIEIVANLDDGIEFFGGKVSPKNLLVWAQGDDGLDIDQAYAGTISNSFVIAGKTSDHSLEIDGGEGSYEAQFTMNNITLQGNMDTPHGEYADFRSHAMGTVKNIYAYGFKKEADIELDKKGNVAENYNAGKLVFGEWQIVLPDGVSDAKSLFNNTSSTPITGFGDTAKAVLKGEQSVGADLSVFDWTYAKQKGAY